MKYGCDVIRDLLPLYQDQVCSAESMQIVKEHLEECEDCRKIAEQLADAGVERTLREECEDVVGKHVKKEKRRSFLIGISLAAVLMIPVVVCLICNIAVGHSLDWFFIVLTALLVFASVTVVPLVIEENRGLVTILGFTGSLLLMLLTICIYVNGTWFPIVAVSVLFGLSVLFLPYVVCRISKNHASFHHKGLIVMIVDTLLLYALIFLCGGPLDIKLKITSFCLLLPWAMFPVIRYLRADGLVRAGICTILCGAFTAVVNDVISWIIQEPEQVSLKYANLLDWSNWQTINGNIYICILLVTVIVGLGLMIGGLIRGRRRKVHNKREI
ncbi:MAG: zf-HC2 domain-containing protein [Lachnospiraceae bacterium]